MIRKCFLLFGYVQVGTMSCRVVVNINTFRKNVIEFLYINVPNSRANKNMRKFLKPRERDTNGGIKMH